jgi:hypothetical protein
MREPIELYNNNSGGGCHAAALANREPDHRTVLVKFNVTMTVTKFK